MCDVTLARSIPTETLREGMLKMASEMKYQSIRYSSLIVSQNSEIRSRHLLPSLIPSSDLPSKSPVSHDRRRIYQITQLRGALFVRCETGKAFRCVRATIWQRCQCVLALLIYLKKKKKVISHLQ